MSEGARAERVVRLAIALAALASVAACGDSNEARATADAGTPDGSGGSAAESSAPLTESSVDGPQTDASAEDGRSALGSSDSSMAGDSAPTPSGGNLLLVAAAVAGSQMQQTTGYSYSAATDTWSAGTVLGSTASGGIDSQNGGVALAFSDGANALAALTNATDSSGVSGPLQFATWSAGKWTPFASVGANVAAFGAPSLSAGSGGFEVAFAADTGHGESTAARAAGAWSPKAPVGTFVGGAPSLAMRGADATAAFVRSSDGALVAVDRASGVWGSAQVVVPGAAAAPANASIPPTLVALHGGGADLLLVYTDSSAADLHSSTRTSGKWSAPLDLGISVRIMSSDPASMATDAPSAGFATPVYGLAGGKAVLAFTSVAQHVYFAQFDGARWSVPTSVFTPWCLDCIDVAQAGLAPGVGSATIEIVFSGDPTSSNAYVPYHTRLVGGKWTTPKPIVSALAGLFSTYALASPSVASP